jgi:hypothetical protein
MKPATTTSATGYRGEVVYLFAFDIAYELQDAGVRELLGQPAVRLQMDTGKRGPKKPFFYRPLTVRLPAVDRTGPHGPVRVETMVKVLSIGAISISVRVPFVVDHVADLVAYHDLKLDNRPLAEEVRQLAERVRVELSPWCNRPVPELAEEEAYTVFCLEAPLPAAAGAPVSAEVWLQRHEQVVAGLLTQEPDVTQLSRQEAHESTDRRLSYYEDDIVVVDWDAALVVDQRRDFEEILYPLELANLQLTELEAYDRLLDDSLDRAYRDLGRQRWGRGVVVLRQLREMRIDVTRLSDELLNISKFFGDWHLARVYQNVSARFHLGDWHRTVDEKLKSLDSLYQLLQHDQTNRWMLVLEATIVLLFVIDVVVLVVGVGKP